MGAFAAIGTVLSVGNMISKMNGPPQIERLKKKLARRQYNDYLERLEEAEVPVKELYEAKLGIVTRQHGARVNELANALRKQQEVAAGGTLGSGIIGSENAISFGAGSESLELNLSGEKISAMQEYQSDISELDAMRFQLYMGLLNM